MHLQQILDLLVEAGYVRREGAGFNVLVHHRHLPESHRLSSPHLALMRLKSADQLQRLSPKQAFSHAVTLTGNEETRLSLAEAYMAFLKKAEAIVRPAPSEHVYQMNFDLFPWSLED